MTKHVRKLGNTLLPLNFMLELNGDPVNLASYTVKMRIEEEGGTVIVNDSTTGVTSHPTQTFTASATTDLLTCNAHGVKDNQQVIVSSSGTLPTGLAASTRYFAVNVTPNAFSLATVPDGAAIDITGAGSGTHSFYIVGSLQYDLQTGDVDAAGFFNSWVIIESSTEQHHFPAEGQHKIEIQAVGN